MNRLYYKMRIGSYNINWRLPQRKERCEALAESIMNEDYDMVFLHEVPIRCRSYFKRDGYYLYNDTENKETSFRSMVLIKKSLSYDKPRKRKLSKTQTDRYYIAVGINGVCYVSCHAETGRSVEANRTRYEQFKQIWKHCNRQSYYTNGFVFLGDVNTQKSVGPFTIEGNSRELTDGGCTWFNDRCWPEQGPNYKRYDRAFISLNINGMLSHMPMGQLTSGVWWSDHNGIMVYHD